jgi:hypothetical protein
MQQGPATSVFLSLDCQNIAASQAFRSSEAGMGSLPAGLSMLPRLLLGCEPNRVLDLDSVADQATGPLDEGEFVGETAL